MNGARRSTTRHTPITNLPELIIPPRVRAARAGRVLRAAEVGMSQSVTMQSRLFRPRLRRLDVRCVGAAGKGRCRRLIRFHLNSASIIACLRHRDGKFSHARRRPWRRSLIYHRKDIARLPSSELDRAAQRHNDRARSGLLQ